MPTYHDVHVTTEEIERKSIFDLPYGVEISCTRVGGWRVWKDDDGRKILLAGEYDDKWLVIDVAEHVIVDSRENKNADSV